MDINNHSETASDSAAVIVSADTDGEAVNMVTEWILQGMSEALIVEAIEQQWPEKTNLFSIARKCLSQSTCELRETAADWCLSATHFLYQKCVEAADYAGAMRAVKQISELALKRPTATPKPADDETFPRVLNVDDRRRQLAERIARRG